LTARAKFADLASYAKHMLTILKNQENIRGWQPGLFCWPRINSWLAVNVFFHQNE